MTTAIPPKNARNIALWLFFVCFMIMGMTVIGAITRLSESGLSITEWNVVSGTVPPLNEQAWQTEFEKYKTSPEFIKKHYWMELADFKKIFFWEWLHRLWGRMIGMVYALPLFYFLARRRIEKGDRLKFIGLLLLGGAQGFMGWFMVKSGLVDRPSVSHYRLAAHLSLALLLYSLVLLMALKYWREAGHLFFELKNKNVLPHFLKPSIAALITLISVTILWGAFVAGLDAGLIYNEFPQMGAGLIPPEWLDIQPLWLNFFENHASVQLTHRALAVFTTCSALCLGVYGFIKTRFWGFAALGLITVVQLCLGIATLLTHVHLHVAATHQLGAVITLTLALICFRGIYKPAV